MKRLFLLLVCFVLTLSSAATATVTLDDNYWKFFSFENTTPESVIITFGPPAIIKTQELYADWVKNQANGCGQLQTYAMGYSMTAGDLNILKGPFGKASTADVIIDKGKVIEVVWTYDNNQLEPAMRAWINHKGFSRIATKKPGVVMIGIWKTKKGTSMTADCYTGGKGATCLGPIEVHYSEDAK
ncbi:MAG TPA: hypothetical protein VF790_10375 [Dissulfurispiraceae bacterium]